MSSGKVGGPGDPKGPKSPADEIKDPRLRKIEKVKEVDEAENEGRRKKFRQFMDSEEKSEPPQREPSPFETEFHRAESSLRGAFNQITRPLDDLENELTNAVQDRENSPPPKFKTDRNENPESQNPLPKSHLSQHDQNSKSDGTEKSQKEAALKKEQIKEKTELLEDLEPLDPKKKDKKIEKENDSTITVPLEEERKIKSAPAPLTPEEEAKIRPRVTKKAKEKERSLTPIHEEAILKKRDPQKDPDDKQRAKSPHVIEIDSPSTTPLPAAVIPISQVATTQAAPYLNSEISPLFFQMVGTIHVINKTPGLSETEIELNSPSFSKSKFFGAKIVIEKYATAPNSLNIRLTGSNQAVKAFNENISNLYAAFSNGAFDFKIGRITTEYSTEKPVFRRREGRSGSDADSSRGGK